MGDFGTVSPVRPDAPERGVTMRRSTVRRLITATICTVAVSAAPMLFALLAPERAEGRSACPRWGKTVERNRESRVFRTRRGSIDYYFGCAFRTGRTFRLGGGNDSVVYALAGRVVAYESLAPVNQRMVVRSLGTGRVIHQANSNLEGAFGNGARAVEVVLKRNGSIAWTYPNRTGESVEATGIELHAIGTSNRREVLSQRVDPAESLRLNPGGATISWTEGAVTRTAPLR